MHSYITTGGISHLTKLAIIAWYHVIFHLIQFPLIVPCLFRVDFFWLTSTEAVFLKSLFRVVSPLLLLLLFFFMPITSWVSCPIEYFIIWIFFSVFSCCLLTCASHPLFPVNLKSGLKAWLDSGSGYFWYIDIFLAIFYGCNDGLDSQKWGCWVKGWMHM